MGTIMSDPGLSRLQLSEENKPLFPCRFLLPHQACVSTHTCCSDSGLPATVTSPGLRK